MKEKVFREFWTGLKTKVEKNGGRLEQCFSFKNPLIKASFGFTSFILDLLGRVNTVSQERLASFPQLWDIIQSLKMEVPKMIDQEPEVFSRSLDCMASLTSDEVAEFQNVLVGQDHCLETRFHSPSTHFNLNHGQATSLQLTSEGDRQSTNPHNCSVVQLMKLFTFPHNVVYHCGSLPLSCPQTLTDQVGRIVGKISLNRTQIVDVYNERVREMTKKVGITVLTQINLCDVFKVIKRDEFPLLWKEMVVMNTIMPTTVSCEQSFSVLKHSAHINMNDETFTANVINKLHTKK